MMVRYVKSDGHTCDEAQDGQIAVNIVKKMMLEDGGENMYDVILMDFIMPNMDGPTATKEIRALGYKGAIFGVTGNGLESDIEYFKSHGANDVLIKPLNYSEFMRAMSIHIVNM